VVTGGTDNHLFLLDLRPKVLDGDAAEKVLNRVGISVNKNAIPGDKSVLKPSGIRIGTPAITTRGAQPVDMKTVARLVDTALNSRHSEEALRSVANEVRTWATGLEYYGC
jgi:glycine hydroxymethyltransferase